MRNNDAGPSALTGADAIVLLADPYSLAIGELLGYVERQAPGKPVIGGLSTSGVAHREAALFVDGEVMHGGGLAVRLDGVDVVPVVAPGVVGVGPELTVTHAEGRDMHEIDGIPAYTALQRVLNGLDPDETELLAGGLRVGVRRRRCAPREQAHWVPRTILNIHRGSSAGALAANLTDGDEIRLFADNADGAERNLREELRLARTALGDTPIAGALMFTCGRRSEAFHRPPQHDLAVAHEEIGPVPTCEILSGGEIGPVDGAPEVQDGDDYRLLPCFLTILTTRPDQNGSITAP